MNITKIELKTLISCMVAMAAADGQLHDREVSVIMEINEKLTGLEVDQGVISDAFEGFLSAGNASVFDILGVLGEEPRDTLKDLIIRAGYLIMVADGAINETETSQLSEIASYLGVPEDRFAELVHSQSSNA